MSALSCTRGGESPWHGQLRALTEDLLQTKGAKSEGVRADPERTGAGPEGSVPGHCPESPCCAQEFAASLSLGSALSPDPLGVVLV